MLEPAFGDGLIVAEGNTWAQQRRMALKFTRKKAHYFEPAIIERIDEFLDAVVAKSDASGFIDPSVDIAATCFGFD